MTASTALGSPSTETPAAKVLELVTKSSVVVLALLYGLGLLVSNIYLISVGVSDFSSVKPKYILTGAWGLLFIVVGSLPVTTPALLRFKIKSSTLEFLLKTVTGAALSAALMIAAYVLLSSAPPDLSMLFPAIRLVLYSSFMVHIGRALVKRVIEARAARVTFTYIQIAVVLCLGTVSVADQIAHSLYGRIPEALGGGQPIAGRIILNKEGVEFWKEAGIEKSDPARIWEIFDDTPRSRSARILYQDEHVMVIEVNETAPDLTIPDPIIKRATSIKTMILSKSLVDAVITDERLRVP
jgi:hypothetical protein